MCFFRRFQVSNLAGSGREPGAGLKSHLASCPACREWQRLQEIIRTRLHAEAQEKAAGISPDLSSRIVMALPKQTVVQAPAVGPVLFPGLAWATAAACVAALLATWIVSQKLPYRAGDGRAESVTAALRVVEGVNPVALSTLAGTPYRNELVSLSHDIQRGLTFVSGCLPGVGSVSELVLQ